ncbi:MAG: M13 family metallopeptidase [Bacteroidota bacterium]
MKKLLTIATALTILVVLAANKPGENENTMEKTRAINKQHMDTKNSPGDNFFKYVNGGWMVENPIPAEHSQYGAFTVLYENNQKLLRQLIKDVSEQTNIENGSVNQKIRDLYNSGMDTVTIEKAGINAISDELDAINNISSIEDIQNYIANMHKSGISPLFYVFADADQQNSSMTIANLYQGGIGLPDVDYYTNDDESSKKLRADYINHLTKMFILAGYKSEEANEKAYVVLGMETQIAEVSKTRLERRDPNANFNKMNLSQLETLSPDFNWALYFKQIGLSNPGEINVSQTDFFKGISNIMANNIVDDWKTYLTWNILDNYANYLSSDFVNQNFEFYGKVLSGTQEIQPRWKRVLNNTSSRLGEAIGQLYVEKHFPPESKVRMLVLVENLKLSFADRINDLTWMSDETKVKALEKLQTITVKIGYPDVWKDYTNLAIVPDSYIQNIRNSREFEFNFGINKVGKPVDKNEWGMTPQTVNAYYSPTHNEIVFPAAILQPPFFNMDADDAVNYGAIGVVIGHEMTHGFDDQGRKYDKDGNLNDWWTKKDAELFEKETALLIKQYDNYSVLDSLHVDGSLTLGENIADVGGLNISYNALQMSYNGNTPAPMEGFTADQRFFLGYAQLWRQNIRDKALIQRLKTDVHSPGDARVNIPPFNLDVFIEAFDITENDSLYIPQKERANIW